MSDSSNESGARAMIALPEALRALPQLAPDASAWPKLAAVLARRASSEMQANIDVSLNARRSTPSVSTRAWRSPRYALPAALAAGLVLALVAASVLHMPTLDHVSIAAQPAPSTSSSATKFADRASSVRNVANDTNMQVDSNVEKIASLQTRSHDLERWLHDTSAASAPQSAQDLAASAEIQDMIGLVDVQLESPDGNAALSLWQRRVGLLEDLSTLRYSSNIHRFDTGIAQLDPAGDHAAAIPASWRN